MGKVGTCMTWGACAWAWLGDNSSSIAAACAILGLVIQGISTGYKIARERRDAR